VTAIVEVSTIFVEIRGASQQVALLVDELELYSNFFQFIVGKLIFSNRW
jgi:hypothetical protein